MSIFALQWSRRVLAGACLLAGGASLAGPAHAGADLKWDLSYQGALRDHPIASNEFMAFWPARYPQRPIHARLAAYDGEPIQASLLLEGPDGHAGYPVAHWYIRTASTAQVCTLYRERADACKPLDPARLDAAIGEVMAFQPVRFTPSDKKTIGELGGKPILLNYHRFLSVYVDGRALQRPVVALELADTERTAEELRHPEAGRLHDVFSRLLLTPAERARQQAQAAEEQRGAEFAEAVKLGDLARLRTMLARDPRIVEAGYAAYAPVDSAVRARRQDVASLLLEHGARIDAMDGVALRSAVEAGDAGMVEFLLARGASADPPESGPDAAGGGTTALSIAVRRGDTHMTRRLLRHGADVNTQRGRAPLTHAALALDLAMMDLLLEAGAKPDKGSASDEGMGILALLMRSHGHVDGARAPSKSAAIREREAKLEKVVRKLAAAGAQVDRVSPHCHTAYGVAQEAGLDAMTALLRELGADPQLQPACQAQRRR